MDPLDARALVVVSLLLLPAPCILLVPGAAGGTGGSAAPYLHPTADDDADVTVLSVDHPAELDPFNYSDVLVLVNNNSAMSKQVGEYFASTRGVPSGQVAYLDVPAREVISWAQFQDLKRQVADHMDLHQLTDSVNYIVTTKGFPLKISNSSLWYRACVDEELALLNGPQEGQIGNAYYAANPYYGARTYFQREDWGIYLVNRLTGYDWDDVRHLIDSANGSLGNRGLFVLDVDPGRDGSPGYKVGNDWLRSASTILEERGEDVFFDDTRWFVNYREDVIGYSSWGSNDGNDTDHAKPHNTWVNGSIAETFVSTGGRTFTPPPRYGQSMIADLIEEGVTGVKGYVYEPFLSAIAHPDILFERYTAGFNLAESYRAASVMLGWMGVVVGDPKCSPYRDVPDLYVDSSMLDVSNITPAAGDRVDLRVEVRNLGGRAENASVTLYVDGGLLFRDNVTFEGFSRTTLNVAFDAPSEVGERELLVVLNEEPDQLFETLYDNNQATIKVHVRERPVVALRASPTQVRTLESVQFSIEVVSAPRTMAKYYFEFDDGAGVTVTSSPGTYHSFDQDGVYNVSAWALDEELVLSYRSHLHVTVLNRAPQAIINITPDLVLSGEDYTFDARSSTDMDGHVVSARWDLGDGNSSDQWEVSHRYQRPGEYTITLRVWDDDGALDDTSGRVTVLNRPPHASFLRQGDEVRKGRPVTFNASASGDPDGRVVQYEWDFGDGEGDVTTSPWAVHSFRAAGNFTVNLTVVDDLGEPASAELEVTVLNTPPVADLRPSAGEVLTGQGVELDPTGSYDPDGELVDLLLTVTGPGGVETVLYTGDGAFLVTYLPEDDGEHVITLFVTDDDGSVSSDWKVLVVMNRPPTLELLPDTALMEGAVVTAPAALSLEASAVDVDGTVVSIQWRWRPTDEVLATEPLYLVQVTEGGQWMLLVEATDDDGASAALWLNLTVNERPDASLSVLKGAGALGDRKVYPGALLTFDGGASTDDGSIAAYSWDFGDGFTGQGARADHFYGAPGTYDVTLIVTDDHGATSEATHQVTIVQRPEEDEGPPLGTVAVIGVVVVIALLVAITLYARSRSKDEGGTGG